MVHEHTAFKALIGEEVGYGTHDDGDNAAQESTGTAAPTRGSSTGDDLVRSGGPKRDPVALMPGQPQIRGVLGRQDAEAQFRLVRVFGCGVHPSHINRALRGDSFAPPIA